MRISMLEKREDFYTILTRTLTESSHLEVMPILKSETFFANKYLNFVAHSSLQENMFQNLVEEYGNSTVFWKTWLQKIYVKFAVSKITRSFFAHKSISLPAHFSSSLILGGNHRLRMFSTGLKASKVILKNGESKAFISNELLLRKEFNLTYSPKLLTIGGDWLEEEYIKGIPLNRLQNTSITDKMIHHLLYVHQKELLNPSKQKLPSKDYLNSCLESIQAILSEKKLRIQANIKTEILNLMSLLTSKITQKELEISWTHGDFQQGNILVRDNEFKVIDWEASKKRFWLYDHFVMLGGIRAHGNIKVALEEFQQKISTFSNSIEDSITSKYILMFEELCYSIHEDCCPNYYQSGEKSFLLAKQIREYTSNE